MNDGYSDDDTDVEYGGGGEYGDEYEYIGEGEYGGRSTAPIDVIRLTPLQHGIPQHDQASVWNFHDKITLALVRRLRTTEDLHFAPGIHMTPCPTLAGITAGLITHRWFICHRATTYIDHLLDRHRDTGMAVETWSTVHGLDKTWMYTLLPRFTRLLDPAEDWPTKTPPAVTVETAGHVHPNPLYTWPDPHPHPARIPPPDEHAYVLYAVTSTRPPRSPYSL